MSPRPPTPAPLRNSARAEAWAASLTAFAALAKRIAGLEAGLNENPTNSLRPPSFEPAAVKVERRPTAPLPGGTGSASPLTPDRRVVEEPVRHADA